jgi:hypothetical protein
MRIAGHKEFDALQEPASVGMRLIYCSSLVALRGKGNLLGPARIAPSMSSAPICFVDRGPAACLM